MDPEPLIKGGHNLRLRTTRSRDAGDVLDGYFGDYRQRLPTSTIYVDCIMLKNLPGKPRFVRADIRCAALYCNDPILSKATQDVVVNCELWEDETKAYSDHERIVLRTLVNIDATEDDPVTLWCSYDVREIKVGVCMCVRVSVCD